MYNSRSRHARSQSTSPGTRLVCHTAPNQHQRHTCSMSSAERKYQTDGARCFRATAYYVVQFAHTGSDSSLVLPSNLPFKHTSNKTITRSTPDRERESYEVAQRITFTRYCVCVCVFVCVLCVYMRWYGCTHKTKTDSCRFRRRSVALLSARMSFPNTTVEARTTELLNSQNAEGHEHVLLGSQCCCEREIVTSHYCPDWGFMDSAMCYKRRHSEQTVRNVVMLVFRIDRINDHLKCS